MYICSMIHPKNLQIETFQYHLPDEKIAKFPLAKRDDSKLLVYNNNSFTDSQYANIAQYLPENGLIVFNQTKVINARLLFQKNTGGKIEIFCLEPDERYHDIITAMSQTKEVYWKCLVGGAGKWKDNQPLTLVSAIAGTELNAQVHEKQNEAFVIKFSWDTSCNFAEILQQAGEIPLPPYLNRAVEEADKTTYQTMFAKEEGSVAAPTAALHFTPATLRSLSEKRIEQAQITLHVGAGTFKPVKAETMDGHEMHPEFIEVETSFIELIISKIKNDQPIIAVGTTSVRTLESLYWIGQKINEEGEINFNSITVQQWFPYECKTPKSTIQNLEALLVYLQKQKSTRLITRTQIIIAPSYDFKIVKAIITNFHQPQSTLLLLISAFIGDKWKTMYEHALQNNYRFLSYGDGCLLLK